MYLVLFAMIDRRDSFSDNLNAFLRALMMGAPMAGHPAGVCAGIVRWQRAGIEEMKGILARL